MSIALIESEPCIRCGRHSGFEPCETCGNATCQDCGPCDDQFGHGCIVPTEHGVHAVFLHRLQRPAS